MRHAAIDSLFTFPKHMSVEVVEDVEVLVVVDEPVVVEVVVETLVEVDVEVVVVSHSLHVLLHTFTTSELHRPLAKIA